MGIDSFLDEELNRDGPICPSCETVGEATDHWYNRCTTPLGECETVTFIL